MNSQRAGETQTFKFYIQCIHQNAENLINDIKLYLASEQKTQNPTAP